LELATSKLDNISLNNLGIHEYVDAKVVFSVISARVKRDDAANSIGDPYVGDEWKASLWGE